MRKLNVLLRPAFVLATLSAAWLAPLAQARAHDPPRMGTMKPGKEGMAPRLEHANTLIGSEVYDPKGYLIGRVSQVLLGRDFDRAAIALVAPMRDPKAEVPVPLTAFRRDAAARLTIDVIAGDLSRVPKVASNDWTELASAGFLEKVDFFFKGHSDRYKDAAELNEPPTLGASEDTGMNMPKATAYQKLTKLIGLDIRTRDADLAGNIEDLIVDFADGKVVFGVVSLNQNGHADKLVVVPWTAIEVRPRQGLARVDATTDVLATLAFAPMSFPNLQDRTYTSRIYQALGREPYWQVYGYAPREADRRAAWRAGSSFNRSFDAARTTSYLGLVDSIGTFVPEIGAADGVRLRVRTDLGDVITVLLGPKTYIDRLGLTLRQGEGVTLTGTETMLDGKSVVLASELQSDSVTYRIRDASGQPLWTPTDIE